MHLLLKNAQQPCIKWNTMHIGRTPHKHHQSSFPVLEFSNRTIAAPPSQKHFLSLKLIYATGMNTFSWQSACIHWHEAHSHMGKHTLTHEGRTSWKSVAYPRHKAHSYMGIAHTCNRHSGAHHTTVAQIKQLHPTAVKKAGRP